VFFQNVSRFYYVTSYLDIVDACFMIISVLDFVPASNPNPLPKGYEEYSAGLSTVVHVYNPSFLEDRARRTIVQGMSG
jgi:hypothetical protein